MKMLNLYFSLFLTGALGFEPRDGGTKTRCLTTWLRPINLSFNNIATIEGVVSSTSQVDLRRILSNRRGIRP